MQEDDYLPPSDQGGDAEVTPLEDAVQVCRVRDGDTIEVQLVATADCTENTGDITAVRLKGINAPETAKPGVPAEPWADAAKEYVQSNVGFTVHLEFNSDCGANWYECRDDYERLLAYAKTTQTDDLAKKVIEQGLARVFRRPNGSIYPFDRQDAYVAAEDQAKAQRLGIWSE